MSQSTEVTMALTFLWTLQWIIYKRKRSKWRENRTRKRAVHPGGTLTKVTGVIVGNFRFAGAVAKTYFHPFS